MDGISTALGLSACADEERIELIDWISSLPTYAYTFIDGRPYLFAHAGIRPGVGRVPSLWDEKGCESYLASQSSEDLIWIREDFWSRPTGLVVQDGTGPVVIAGHTPVVFAEKLCDLPNNAAINEEGFAQILYCGRCEWLLALLLIALILIVVELQEQALVAWEHSDSMMEQSFMKRCAMVNSSAEAPTIILAPDSFKGTLSSAEVSAGIKEVLDEAHAACKYSSHNHGRRW